MARHYYALDLRDDAEAIAEYERWHQPGHVWPEIIASIRASGVEEMEIFRTGNRLVMVVQMVDGDEVSRERDAANAKTLEWEALMDGYQQRLPWAEVGQKWVPMRRIFSLAES
ncbi:L-rhamnose mutarotase [Dyella caseinilytica]|uniref:L-rhamnose mutarotase n=1 Tax=Dyella caseinilytica TaxID=1849581 RepID=A0ABX7GNX7_9GAMM|nr:L-rhamnose mutarotase [Dyella caseinilytica]QRN51930.1 L-rhamnose mutarotase [Dyella caseinilytica]GGA03719.1 L-fucose mutarotase [Dyella caseinilytica]